MVHGSLLDTQWWAPVVCGPSNARKVDHAPPAAARCVQFTCSAFPPNEGLVLSRHARLDFLPVALGAHRDAARQQRDGRLCGGGHEPWASSGDECPAPADRCARRTRRVPRRNAGGRTSRRGRGALGLAARQTRTRWRLLQGQHLSLRVSAEHRFRIRLDAVQPRSCSRARSALAGYLARDARAPPSDSTSHRLTVRMAHSDAPHGPGRSAAP